MYINRNIIKPKGTAMDVMLEQKLWLLAQKVEDQTKHRLIDQDLISGNECAWPVTVKTGKKYTKVDVGRSGKYMVVNETGEIYGIKAYGVIHKGHYYGTLDEINSWNWGGYTAIPLIIV